MITKNEENFLEQCLNSAKGIVDEIIIVDTGSTDKTKEICKKFNFKEEIKFFDFEWIDDFSAARNESLKHATKDWILVLDADEIVDEENIKIIKELVKDKENDGFLFLQRNHTNDSSIAGFVNENHVKDKVNYSGWYGSFIVRLFRNKKGYLFDGTVHELVEPSIENKKGKIAATGIVIHHYGNINPDVVKKKRQFYLKLCENKVKKKPDASSYYELGVLYKENCDFSNAINSFDKTIELNPKHSNALFELGVVYEQQKDYDAAVKNYVNSAAIKESSEAFQNLGVCYLKKGMYKEAYSSLTKAMLLNANKYTIYNSLGAVLEKMGNYDTAAQMLEIAVKLNPSNTIGFYNFGIVLDKKGDCQNPIRMYEKAVELGHKNKVGILKRISQLKKIVDNVPNYKYSFGVGE